MTGEATEEPVGPNVSKRFAWSTKLFGTLYKDDLHHLAELCEGAGLRPTEWRLSGAEGYTSVTVDAETLDGIIASRHDVPERQRLQLHLLAEVRLRVVTERAHEYATGDETDRSPFGVRWPLAPQAV
jgi:hypothetical protein